MFSWLKRKTLLESPPLRHSEYYSSVAHNTGGTLCRIKLSQAENDDNCVALTYHWTEDLTYEQADKLDSRVRAYMSSVIYDAAKLGGIKCKRGPRHGSRPSWYLQGADVPLSLISAGFEYDEKVCWIIIGPIMAIQGVLPGYVSTAWKLAHSFNANFRQIIV